MPNHTLSLASGWGWGWGCVWGSGSGLGLGGCQSGCGCWFTFQYPIEVFVRGILNTLLGLRFRLARFILNGKWHFKSHTTSPSPSPCTHPTPTRWRPTLHACVSCVCVRVVVGGGKEVQWPLATRLSDQDQVSPGCRNFRDMNIKQFLPFETVECTLLFNLLLSPDASRNRYYLQYTKLQREISFENIFIRLVFRTIAKISKI